MRPVHTLASAGGRRPEAVRRRIKLYALLSVNIGVKGRKLTNAVIENVWPAAADPPPGTAG